jgi:small-conductance mechanosensitive channel
VSIPNEEDPDRVTQAIRDASASLMQDSDFKPHILEPIDVYGIDAWEPGQVTIKARIKTVPLKQWFVGRELRRRIMRTFKERGVKVPVPRMELKVDREDSGA